MEYFIKIINNLLDEVDQNIVICLWRADKLYIYLFYHSITEFVFLMNILRKRSDLPFSRKSDRKKEKSTVSFTQVHNIISSQTQLDGIAHEQTIICRQLFADHVVGSRPTNRKKNLLRMRDAFLS